MPNKPERKQPSWLKAKSSEAFRRKLDDHSHLYNSRHWRTVRLMHIRNEPLCRTCLKDGKVTDAKVVDHIEPLRLGGSFWLASNHQSLCVSCHNSKSAKESHQPTTYEGRGHV